MGLGGAAGDDHGRTDLAGSNPGRGYPRRPQPRQPADGARGLHAMGAKRPGERSERLWTHGDNRRGA